MNGFSVIACAFHENFKKINSFVKNDRKDEVFLIMWMKQKTTELYTRQCLGILSFKLIRKMNSGLIYFSYRHDKTVSNYLFYIHKHHVTFQTSPWICIYLGIHNLKDNSRLLQQKKKYLGEVTVTIHFLEIN